MAASSDQDLPQDGHVVDDRAALAELVGRHRGLVYGVALSITGDPTLAEDVAQESFVEAWRQLPQLRDPDRPGPWLTGIARNLDAAAWKKLRERVRQAREQRERQGQGGGVLPPAPPAPVPTGQPQGSLDKDTIREAIRAIMPLVRECYDHALERAGGADVDGRVVVDFRIEGEPSVGGVITESAINDAKSTAADPQMRECVQESMYALQLPPPKNGGAVKVSYPFVFKPSRKGGDAAPSVPK
jgi:RNA polymerase sigma-70 factor (ECF subfamily)